MLNYLDLLNDLLPNNINNIDFEIFSKLKDIINFFYTIKDGNQITLLDNIKDHKLIKNEELLVIIQLKC